MSKVLLAFDSPPHEHGFAGNVPAQLFFNFALMLVLVIVLYCFWPALSGPFIFDDFPNLENLRHLNAGISLQSLAHYLGTAKDSPGRPLSMLSFLIEDSAWPAYPADYKRNNLLFHLITGLLVLSLALKLARQQPWSATMQRYIPMLCMAAWLLNPIQLSSTMLVVQRMNILSSLFMLAGLVCYLTCLESQRYSPIIRAAFAGLNLAIFGSLAFLCKENGVLIFAYASALNFSLLKSLLASYPTASRRLLLLGAALPIIGLALAAGSHWSAIEAPYAFREFTLYERLISQPRILLDYLANILLPRIGGHGIWHDDYAFSRSLLSPPGTLLALAVLATLLLAALRYRRRQPLFAFAVFWFLAGHLIESSVVGLELYFEHRNYLPMFGPLFALLGLAMPSLGRMTLIIRSVAIAWLLTNAVLTRVNAITWGDRGIQSQVWLQEHPYSARAAQWAASYQFDSGHPDLAQSTLELAIERMPAADDLRLQVLLIECMQRGITDSQWANGIATIQRAKYSELMPRLFSSFTDQLLGKRCHGTLDRAKVLAMGGALMRNKNYLHSFESKSHLHYEIAKIYLADHQLNPLMHHLDLAYLYNPTPSIAREQAIYLLSAGLPEQALIYLEKSDATPLSWLKMQLQRISTDNSELIKSANVMINAKLEREQTKARLENSLKNPAPIPPLQ